MVQVLKKVKLIRSTDIKEINKNLIIQKFYKGTKAFQCYVINVIL